MNLSILIPTYNFACVTLVEELHRMAVIAQQGGVVEQFEIIVADDGSTDRSTIERNKAINKLHECRYIINHMNNGRAIIRNFLVHESRFERLLFIDSDMTVSHADYLQKYLECATNTVVYGGYTVPERPELEGRNLRYIYEKQYKGNADAALRNMKPYENFHSCNFMAPRSVMLKYPFDERFRHYGYEDVMLGNRFKRWRVPIIHIDNPLSFDYFEKNLQFIHKTEEGIKTLYIFRRDLADYSKLIKAASKLKQWHLFKPFLTIYNLSFKPIRERLKGNKPSIFLFNIYRLGYFCTLISKHEKTALNRKR